MSPKINIFVVLISVLAGLFGSYVFYTQIPFDWFSASNPSFGTTITTINGSDRISDSRTTINDNFSSLNTNKFELSDWYATTSAPQILSAENLATVGTITSGTWSGTAIGVAKGGTNITSYTSGDIIYASGATTLSKLAKGSDGDFLTLASGVPAWTTSAIDKTANYLWSGLHNFTNSSTLIKGLVASTTISFNNGGSGISYTWTQTSHAASSTSLMEDGSGNLSFQKALSLPFAVNTDAQLTTTASATTSLATITIPANTLTVDKAVRVFTMWANHGGGDTCHGGINVGNGTSSSTVAYVLFGNGTKAMMNTYDMATSTASELWASVGTGLTSNSGAFTTSPTQYFGHTFTQTDYTSQSYIDINGRNNAGSITCELVGYSVEILRQQ